MIRRRPQAARPWYWRKLLAWLLVAFLLGFTIARATSAPSVVRSTATPVELTAVRASAPSVPEAVPVPAFTTQDPDAFASSPAARAHQEPRGSDSSTSSEGTKQEAATILALIHAAALEFGADPDLMLRRAFCESSYRPDAVGRAQEVSIFQFMPSTWVIYAPRLGYTLREIGHVEAQARVAAYMESIGEGRQWTCR